MTLRPPICALLLLLPAAAPLAAQILFDPAVRSGVAVREAFERTFADRSLPRLDCAVRTTPARLSYDLQIYASFEFTLPFRQFADQKRRSVLLNVFRVTPRKPAGETRWFVRRWPLPPIPEKAAVDKRLAVQLGGGFIVGPGSYDVEWLLLDGADRVCRHSWRVTARESRAASLGIPPGMVDDDRRLMNWRGPSATSGDARSATILLHAAPTFRRRYSTHLSWWDRRLLLTSLTNTIDRGGFASARVIVIDLQRRRTLFESDDFRATDYRRLAELLADVELATIDYQTLATGPSEWEFLESIVAAERQRPAALPDALVFIAPAWREGERRRPLSSGLLEGLPRVFAVALAPFGRFSVGTVVDFARSARGRVFNVFHPPDLASATERLRRELDAASR